MARVVFAPRAIADAQEILTTLVETAGKPVARAFSDQFAATFSRLAMFPLSGAPRPRFGSGIRIAVVSPYIVIYRAISEDVEIMRIVHGHRKITRRMLK